MASENLERMKEAWERVLRGEPDLALKLSHPDIVSFRAPPLPDPKTYHGPKGVLRIYADWRAEFASFEMDTGEITDVGDRVLVEVLQHATGQASGAAVQATFWFLYTFNDDCLVTEIAIYQTREQALEAARSQPG